MTATAALQQWRTLADIIRRADSARIALSRLDPCMDSQARQTVETELADLQTVLARQANALTVYTLQAEAHRVAHT